MAEAVRIGIDLGGTKIEAIALNSDGEELFRRRIPTPQGDYRATVSAVVALVTEVETELGLEGESRVGIGIPGTISSASGLVKNANSTCLIGEPLQQDLERELSRQLTITNDANCFAMSEATDGAAAGKSAVFGVILGTGVGGGIVVNGQVLTGLNAIAGEWGHNPLPWPSGIEVDDNYIPDCYCGRSGCIESYLSGPALVRDFQRVGGYSGWDVEQIVVAAQEGNELAESTLQRYEERLARGLASVINILDPDVVVLGGGLSNIQRLYQNVPQIWARYIFSDQVDTLLVAPKFGDSSGVRGAAWL
ncbi:MAG: ROK family protein [Gammaproteobacteria bacterium]|nr:ROK family protein [Gammaproteobacteria bacterium]